MTEAIERGDAAVDEHGKLPVRTHHFECCGRFHEGEEDESADPDDDRKQTQRAQKGVHVSIVAEPAFWGAKAEADSFATLRNDKQIVNDNGIPPIPQRTRNE